MKARHSFLVSACIASVVAWLYHAATGRHASWGYWLALLFVFAFVVVPNTLRQKRKREASDADGAEP